uniref:Ig-like domain-containing protein n=1 Tax=Xenopus tropicalis TaxID=8364 RepID=A0A803JF05_XENTR
MSYKPILVLVQLIIGYSAVTIKQSYISVTREASESKSAAINCQIKDSAYIHWYKQKNSEEPKRILYSNNGNAVYEQNTYREKYGIRSSELIIKDIIREDEATYYCACWDTAQ